MFEAWFELDLDIFRLNFPMITPIPKEIDARNMKKFRPISLQTAVLRFFTKVLTNRLAILIGRLISDHQSAIVRGRFVLESVVTTHEVVHVVHSTGQKGLVFNIDYENA